MALPTVWPLHPGLYIFSRTLNILKLTQECSTFCFSLNLAWSNLHHGDVSHENLTHFAWAYAQIRYTYSSQYLFPSQYWCGKWTSSTRSVPLRLKNALCMDWRWELCSQMLPLRPTLHRGDKVSSMGMGSRKTTREKGELLAGEIRPEWGNNLRKDKGEACVRRSLCPHGWDHTPGQLLYMKHIELAGHCTWHVSKIHWFFLGYPSDRHLWTRYVPDSVAVSLHQLWLQTCLFSRVICPVFIIFLLFTF